jgi:hypothetical protein
MPHSGAPAAVSKAEEAMKSRLLAAFVGAVTLSAAAETVQDRPDRVEQQSMQQAVAFEKHKQKVADRQARIEQQRTSTNQADRSADRQEQPKAKSHHRKAPVNPQ